MGISRDEAWTEMLTEIRDDEDEPQELRDAASASLEVIAGGEYRILRDALMRAGSDEIPRDRLFPAAGRQAASLKTGAGFRVRALAPGEPPGVMSPSHIDDATSTRPSKAIASRERALFARRSGPARRSSSSYGTSAEPSAGATSSCSAPSARPGTTYRSSSFTREAPTRARSSSRSAGRRRVPSPTRADACMRCVRPRPGEPGAALRALGLARSPRRGALRSGHLEAGGRPLRPRWSFPRSRGSGARRAAGGGRGHDPGLRRARADCCSARVSRGVPVPRKPEGAMARRSSVPWRPRGPRPCGKLREARSSGPRSRPCRRRC